MHEQIRGTVKAEKSGDEVIDERLRWFGRVLRRDRVNKLDEGCWRWRRRGRPQRRFVVGCKSRQSVMEADDPLWRPPKGTARRRRMLLDALLVSKILHFGFVFGLQLKVNKKDRPPMTSSLH